MWPWCDFNQHRLHQVPISHGQPLQPQPACTCSLVSSPGYTAHTDVRPHRLGWRQLTCRLSTFDIDCHRLTAKQDFPPRKEIFKLLTTAFDTWHRKNAMPSVPYRNIVRLWDECWPQRSGFPRVLLTETSSSSTTLSLEPFSQWGQTSDITPGLLPMLSNAYTFSAWPQHSLS